LYKTATAVEHTDRENTPWASGFQLSLRVSSLRSIEQFLDNSINLSSAQYEHVSLVDWLHLVSGVVSLGKLAIYSSPLPGWDPDELQIARTFDYFREQLSSHLPRPRDNRERCEDVFERFRRVITVIQGALKNPDGYPFELGTGSGRNASLFQDVTLPKLNGMTNGTEKLPSLWKVAPSFDMNSNEFLWRCLMGTV
jgi:hypothetical protein